MAPLVLLATVAVCTAAYVATGLLLARLTYYRFPKVFYSMSDDRDIALITHIFMWPLTISIELIASAILALWAVWAVSDGPIEKFINWFMGWKKRG